MRVQFHTDDRILRLEIILDTGRQIVCSVRPSGDGFVTVRDDGATLLDVPFPTQEER